MTIFKPLKFAFKEILPPKLFLRLLIWKRGYPEPELKLIKILSDRNKISIDIGASEGLYTSHLYFYSKKCVAFEPRPQASFELGKLFSGLIPPIQIETVALSDFEGSSKLKIFEKDKGRSTIEKTNLIEEGGEIDIISTPVKKLDNYIFNDSIGFIKIDVEGHEEEVLKGAEQILIKDRPNILVEVEERHKKKSIENVFKYLQELGYKGFYFKDGHLMNINQFNIEIHQNMNALYSKGKYINNFIFLTYDKEESFSHLL